MKERRLFYCITALLLTLIICILFANNDSSSSKKSSFSLTAAHTPYLQWWNNFSYALNQLNINDYFKLVNYNFHFDILEQVCNNSTILLVLISSAPANYEKRTKIRQTWGRKQTDDVELLFVLGQSGNKTLEEKIQIESSTFKDLIQGSFMDSYRNLTYKHLTSFKYAIYHCPQAKFILKLDDDVFVNIAFLRNFLRNDLSPLGVSNVLYCVVKDNADALRSYRSKWRVSFAQYPLRKYPRYCFGWVILYSPDVLFALYKSTQNISNVFWIDDVYITGIIAEKVHVNHTDITDLVLFKTDRKKLIHNDRLNSNNYNNSKSFLFSLLDDMEEMEVLWKHVLSHRLPKSALENIRKN